MTPTDPVEARLIASLHAPITDAQAWSLRERVRATMARPAVTGGRRLTRPRRRTVVGTLIAAALLVASATAAQRSCIPDRPYPVLEAALAVAFAGTHCVSPAAARQTVRAQLDGLGSCRLDHREPGAVPRPRAVSRRRWTVDTTR